MPEIVVTEDGSITCLDAATGELYHNRAGAYTEALKNYVLPSGIESLLLTGKDLRVLDVCFGLGYNSFVLIQRLLSLLAGRVKAQEKFALELIGLDQDRQIFAMIAPVLESANFADLPSHLKTAISESASKFSYSSDDQICQVSCSAGAGGLALELELRLADVRGELPQLVRQYPQSFDLIFHDGFSPRHVPELWSIDLFKYYVELLKPTGKILTYSSAVAVRGALKALGLIVKRTAAVGGKSGGTIAALLDEFEEKGEIYPLTAEEEKRLASSSATPYRDPSLIDTRSQILARRLKEIADWRLPEAGESLSGSC
jgi:hypothetical protein